MDPASPELLNEKEQGESGETTTEVLLAISETNPATNEKFWYVRGPANEKIPINTQEDNGKVREILDDNTLGREVVQNPADDPETFQSLYGPLEVDNDPNHTSAEQTLPSTQKTEVQPIALTTENLPDDNPDNPIAGNQVRANALAAQSAAIKTSIADAAPSNDSTSETTTEFSENTAAYHEKLQSNLDSITGTLMQKADTLGGLGMLDAARLFANRTEFVHSIINQEIDSANQDYAALVDVYNQYFDGNPANIISKVDPILSVDPSTIKFNQLLSQANTIPELSYLADRLVKFRHDLKIQKLTELNAANTATEQQQITEDLTAAELAPGKEAEPSASPINITDFQAPSQPAA